MSRQKRVKKSVQPPRDPRLVMLAQHTSRLREWNVEWTLHGSSASEWWMLRLIRGSVGVDVTTDDNGALICYADFADHWNRPARTPTEALRSAYAALGVALDSLEESGLGHLETHAQDSDA